jgi:putative endonuclease
LASWFVYLARCADDSLYCGISTDVAARVAEHDAGMGARYTRGRGPLAIVATARVRTKSLALRVEHAVKRLSRPRKLAVTSATLQRIARQVSRRRSARDTLGV